MPGKAISSPYEGSGALTREQFLFHEMRTVAELMEEEKTDEDIIESIVADNMFQYPTEKSLRLVTQGCLRRLHGLNDKKLIRYIASSDAGTAKQICLYAMMLQYRIVADFMITVIGNKYRQRDYTFHRREVNAFLMRLREQDELVDSWAESTLKKIGTVITNRKWYGNNEYVIYWFNNGEKVSGFQKSNIRNREKYLQPGRTWSSTSSGDFSCRYCFGGFIFDSKGCMAFVKDKAEDTSLYLLAAMNTVCNNEFLKAITPTIDFNPGPVSRAPLALDEKQKVKVAELARNNIAISKDDWNSYEISWDFTRHPFLTYVDAVAIEEPMIDYDTNGKQRWICNSDRTSFFAEAYENWKRGCEERFTAMQRNEAELNRIFIDIYGLQEEMAPGVADKGITVHRIYDSKDEVPKSMRGSSYISTKQDEIKSFISYAIGCMFGRYSLDEDGLIYAGGEWDARRYKTYIPDEDNVLPVTDEAYFDDDLISRFVEFVALCYGETTLEENLTFIAKALDERSTDARVTIRTYILNDFFKNHVKTYQKRPIYWLFDSGKKNGFKCLIYMHRYQPDTIARIRTDYIHGLQARYRTLIEDVEQHINTVSGSERARLSNRLHKLQDQAEEIRVYEEKIHHLADQMIPIDLDDGVKVNYEKFKEVLSII